MIYNEVSVRICNQEIDPIVYMVPDMLFSSDILLALHDEMVNLKCDLKGYSNGI